MSKMKIVILTLPRTGSKMLQQNLQSYLTACDSSTLSIDHPSLGLGEFLVKTRLASDECLVPHVEFIAPNRLEYSSDKTSASDELANRINLITSLNNSLVIKEFVFDSFDLSEVLHLADRVYILTRDRNDRILNAVFSHSFNIFNVNQARTSVEFTAFRNTGTKFSIPKEAVDLFIAQQEVFEKFEPP